MTKESIQYNFAKRKTVHFKTRRFIVASSQCGLVIYDLESNATLPLFDDSGALIEKENLFFTIPQMGEESARYVQNFGEQHPAFKTRDMNRWRKIWEMESKFLDNTRQIV